MKCGQSRMFFQNLLCVVLLRFPLVGKLFRCPVPILRMHDQFHAAPTHPISFHRVPRTGVSGPQKSSGTEKRWGSFWTNWNLATNSPTQMAWVFVREFAGVKMEVWWLKLDSAPDAKPISGLCYSCRRHLVIPTAGDPTAVANLGVSQKSSSTGGNFGKGLGRDFGPAVGGFPPGGPAPGFEGGPHFLGGTQAKWQPRSPISRCVSKKGRL